MRFYFLEGPYALMRAARKSGDLEVVCEDRRQLRRARIVAVMLLRNEAARLPFLFSYYRNRGVEHFLVVDNESSDDTQKFLRAQPDVSCFVARGSYRNARYGCDWVNWLLSTRCRSQWILWVDADEHVVFMRDGWNDSLPLAVDALEASGQSAVQGVMIDMYSSGRPCDNTIGVGDDPILVCDLFDDVGYSYGRDPSSRTTWISGGVRRRLFFVAEPDKAPVLNKTPLVRWRWHYAFLKSTHQLWPAHLNEAGPERLALLHFKFTSVSSEKVGDRANREQHTAEYERYDAWDDVSYVDDKVTRRYFDPGSLSGSGLMEPASVFAPRRQASA